MKQKHKYKTLKKGSIIKEGDEISCVSNPKGLGYVSVDHSGYIHIGRRLDGTEPFRCRRRIKPKKGWPKYFTFSGEPVWYRVHSREKDPGIIYSAHAQDGQKPQYSLEESRRLYGSSLVEISPKEAVAIRKSWRKSQ